MDLLANGGDDGGTEQPSHSGDDVVAEGDASVASITDTKNREVTDNAGDGHCVPITEAEVDSLRLPTATSEDVTWFHGGYVVEPTAGVHEHVIYPDLSSLYPNTMRTLNMSIETMVGDEKELSQSQWTKGDCVWGWNDYRPVKHCERHEDWQQYTDGEYKAVKAVDSNGDLKLKWDDDPEYEPLYFLDHDVAEGYIASNVADALEMKERYRGTPKYEAVKRVTNCFTPDTEVMTPDGVKEITDLEVGDDVYSLDPETEQVEVKPVTDTHEYPDYDGELVHIDKTTMDFAVTPNHRMLVKESWKEDADYRFVEAGDLSGSGYRAPHDWEPVGGDEIDTVDLTEWYDTDEYEVHVNNGVHGHTFASEVGFYPPRSERGNRGDTVNGYRLTGEEFEQHCEYVEDVCSEIYIHTGENRKWVPYQYDGDDFLQFLAWFITEGSVYVSEDKVFNGIKRGSSTNINLAQQDSRGRDDIEVLLDSMGLDAYVGEKNYTLASKILGDILLRLCGEGSFEKHIPEFVFETSERQKLLFLNTLIKGDGDRGMGSWRYTTSSKRLRDDVMRLCTHLGLSVKYGKDSGSWRIYCSENRKNQFQPKRCVERTTADNGVYCVTVADNHTLLAGRNGTFNWVGQSVYGVHGTDKFRLFDVQLGEAVTMTGRKVIQHTADVFKRRMSEVHGYDARVIAGDTDSAVLSLKDAEDAESVLDSAFKVAEWLNDDPDGYDSFMRELTGVTPENNHMEVEVESYSDRAYFHDAKKRYFTHVEWDDDDGWEADDRNVKGFEMVRSDVADVTVEAQETVADALLEEDSLEAARKRIYPYLRELRKEVLATKGETVPLQKLGTRRGVSKPLGEYGETDRKPHPAVRGLKYTREHFPHEDGGEGSKPYYYPVRRIVDDSLPTTYSADTAEDGEVVDYVAVENPSHLEGRILVDRDEIWQKQVVERVNPILKNVEMSMVGAITGTHKSQLESFM